MTICLFVDINATTHNYEEMVEKIAEIKPYKAVLAMSRCNVWNEVTEQWDSSGCEVSYIVVL